ncbi:MAG TPA: chromosome segregation protein SMC [Vicinamibacterales bacterium]|nr:chromosome segregation protein SMC [Vicinamibacterales bacterium]
MRLNRIEIAGFKSFPDRSELTFDEGVTAIVGPNGCGKSNVVDALTWVLGEQSAKSLRGDRMEDVIFGGSDARKPTAAAEVRLRLSGVAARVPSPGEGGSTRPARVEASAELGAGEMAVEGAVAVALELDDEPLIVKDVELMRRLYRSGESEYLIDGENCRLRDVQDLLMDAGLGIKAYAVIEQGKIGQILSARPTDRRQLIEEAAGVTKYKSRRRQAELKLEAAQQNLTRVDDIVFEVEKQRGTLKRQAAKARRYRRLRDELRRWEKVQFANRYRVLGESIQSARTRLAGAREREVTAAARLAEVEALLERLRLELTEADSTTTAAREAAHARELEIGRLQQQIAFDRQQVETLTRTAAEIGQEVESLETRREPARLELETRRSAQSKAAAERTEAAVTMKEEEDAYAGFQRGIEGLEADVEAARSEVFAAVNAATALRHAVEHAASARARITEQLNKLEVESADLRVEADRAARERASAETAMSRARQAMDALRVDRGMRDSELAGARAEREDRAREYRTREHELAGLLGRLKSLEELAAARAEYGDAARLVLAESQPDVSQLGSVADFLEVEAGYERAVEACLGDILQHVVVPTHDHAAAGLRFARTKDAGRVGFLVAAAGNGSQAEPPAPGLIPVSQVARVGGAGAGAIRSAIADMWIAPRYDEAQAAAGATRAPIATPDGDVFRGSQVVQGGARAEARGILTTKREIKELREQGERGREAVERLRADISQLDVVIAGAESAILSLQSEQHRQEKSVVGYELQVSGAAEAAERIGRKQDQIATERRSAEEELRAQVSRHDEARASIARIEVEQRAADEQLNAAQRKLFEAREAMQAQGVRTAEAKAAHAALVERASGLATEVQRLEAAARELEERVQRRREDLERADTRRRELGASIVASEARLDADLRAFDGLREQVRIADDRSQTLRNGFEEQEVVIRDARRTLEAIRAEVARFDVERATAEADLTHLAASCVDAVQATLDEVTAEVEQLERDGLLASPRPVDDAPDAAEVEEDGQAAAETAEAKAPPLEATPLTPDEMVADLRAKIEKMGAVNMMAIDQFDDLEARHTFLTAQRKDLVDAIAATGEAIRKIDKTTRERFREAFAVINQNFEGTFTTLFGGGKAGLVLLDESDTLESGIDIIAQPPGKRLQSVQLLSGGEKALTAMALMFAIFKYRPSPFCLLDEIDAPLDDANIGRFVEMLQGMQDHTQFILITHNRKTMEIANRLYGVTMEEPGVSKLISVQLN